ncbi:MAG: hypothetical protein EXX96DRAFT_540553 [Benjaminiella poitrasii]|nr:MAG: hypothetical protein EXX96DRAFT_540553 [Benjaminiella poitrasii]
MRFNTLAVVAFAILIQAVYTTSSEVDALSESSLAVPYSSGSAYWYEEMNSVSASAAVRARNRAAAQLKFKHDLRTHRKVSLQNSYYTPSALFKCADEDEDEHSESSLYDSSSYFFDEQSSSYDDMSYSDFSSHIESWSESSIFDESSDFEFFDRFSSESSFSEYDPSSFSEDESSSFSFIGDDNTFIEADLVNNHNCEAKHDDNDEVHHDEDDHDENDHNEEHDDEDHNDFSSSSSTFSSYSDDISSSQVVFTSEIISTSESVYTSEIVLTNEDMATIATAAAENDDSELFIDRDGFWIADSHAEKKFKGYNWENNSIN